MKRDAIETISLPAEDRRLRPYHVREPRKFARPVRPFTRIAYAAAHIVADPWSDRDPWLEAAVDWGATIAFRSLQVKDLSTAHTNEYDRLARGQWTPVLRTAGEKTALRNASSRARASRERQAAERDGRRGGAAECTPTRFLAYAPRPPGIYHHAMALRLAERAETDRPRERLWALGAAALTGQELLAILLGTGHAGGDALAVAGEVMARVEGSLRRLASRPGAELAQVPGVGRAKAARLVDCREELVREGLLTIDRDGHPR